jgi:hypothetical protein
MHMRPASVPACRLAMRGTTRGQLALLATIALALAASSCSKERTLSASEFVADVNEQGVELTLGERLSTSDEDREIYEIELEPLQGAPAPPDEEGGEHAHAGGSLYVYDDTEAADEEVQACQAAADLVCYRAANVVVILEGGGIEAQRLGVAIQKLAEE